MLIATGVRGATSLAGEILRLQNEVSFFFAQCDAGLLTAACYSKRISSDYIIACTALFGNARETHVVFVIIMFSELLVVFGHARHA